MVPLNIILKNMRQASTKLAAAESKLKNKALQNIYDKLKENSSQIYHENMKDLDAAEKNNLAFPLLKRLKFDEKKINYCSIGNTDSHKSR